MPKPTIKLSDDLLSCPNCNSTVGITFTLLKEFTLSADFLTKELKVCSFLSFSPNLFGKCLHCGENVSLNLFFSSPSMYTQFREVKVKEGKTLGENKLWRIRRRRAWKHWRNSMVGQRRWPLCKVPSAPNEKPYTKAG